MPVSFPITLSQELFERLTKMAKLSTMSSVERYAGQFLEKHIADFQFPPADRGTPPGPNAVFHAPNNNDVHRSKLTDKEREEILDKYFLEDWKIVDIARRFGSKHGTIVNILRHADLAPEQVQIIVSLREGTHYEPAEELGKRLDVKPWVIHHLRKRNAQHGTHTPMNVNLSGGAQRRRAREQAQHAVEAV